MFLRQFRSEGIPAVLSLSLLAPLERYLIISQTRGISRSPEQYKTLLSFLQTAPQREGYLSYWRGNISALNRYFLFSAIRFRTYHYIRNSVIEDPSITGSELFIKEGVVALLTTSVAQIMAYPFEVARSCTACDFTGKGEIRNYSGGYDVLQKTISSRGIKNCYNGLLLSIATTLPAMVVSCKTFEMIERVAGGEGEQGSEGSEGKGSENFSWSFLAAAVVAQATVYPLEVLRRRRQVADGESFHLEPGNVYSQSMRIFKAEGIKGFYRGISISIARLVPLIAIQGAIYRLINTPAE